MRLLEVTHLRKTFGNLIAVDDISFEVRTGEIFGLLGPNGAGKSTTMMMLTGLIVPDAGTIELNGQIIEPNNRRAHTCLGVVPQKSGHLSRVNGAGESSVFRQTVRSPRRD